MSDAAEQNEDSEDSVCTTFRVATDAVDETGEPMDVWEFECTRCGFWQGCVGDPEGFGGRPYSCNNCGWVSLLKQDELEAWAEDNWPPDGDADD